MRIADFFILLGIKFSLVSFCFSAFALIVFEFDLGFTLCFPVTDLWNIGFLQFLITQILIFVFSFVQFLGFRPSVD